MKKARGAFLTIDKGGPVFVGYEEQRGAEIYQGPVAQITADKNWLRIVADPYDNHLMLNIETLPVLRRALARIARQLKAKERP